ncbi:MAG: hypothetical protein EOM87_07810, partial [Clostridia bacterium]|nr:hypothetical protein [Clostridia bacterium]
PLCSYAERGIQSLPYCVVPCMRDAHIEAADYVAVVYTDMPLITAEYLYSAANEMKMRGIKSMELHKASITEYREFCFEGGGAKHKVDSYNTTVVEDAKTLSFVTEKLYSAVSHKLINKGVIIPFPNRVLIDDTVKVAEGVVIDPYVSIKGCSEINPGVNIGSYTDMEDTFVGSDTVIMSSNIKGAVIGKNCAIGPFAVIRKGSKIGDGVRLGDFVEIKNSTIGDNVKCAHLAYIGDAEVGNATNVGCGTVFANYDGVKKHRTVVGSEVFIGCNTNLVAPLTIGDNAYIAAGSTVTRCVPDGALCIARERQIIKEDWISKKSGGDK